MKIPDYPSNREADKENVPRAKAEAAIRVKPEKVFSADEAKSGDLFCAVRLLGMSTPLRFSRLRQ